MHCVLRSRASTSAASNTGSLQKPLVFGASKQSKACSAQYSVALTLQGVTTAARPLHRYHANAAELPVTGPQIEIYITLGARAWPGPASAKKIR